MSKSVFISHSARDKDLVREIVSLIEEGIGVPEGEIFCSSLDGYGIPSGKNFVTYMKEQLVEPKVVVLVLTPAYFESKFCMSELGAAWVKSHYIFPILVPPLRYSDVKDVLLGVQLTKIDEDIKYNELREYLSDSIKLNPRSITKWDTKRRAFLKALDPLLKKIAGPTLVSGAEFNEKLEQLAEAQTELDASEAEIRRLKERLAATEKLKSKADVAGVRAKYSNRPVATTFNSLTNKIKQFRSVVRSSEVMKFALSEHYGKPYEINWYQYRGSFEEAARLGFVEFEDSDRVIWSKRQMKELKHLLDKLDDFILENEAALRASEADDVPLEPGDQDFWEYHYEI